MSVLLNKRETVDYIKSASLNNPSTYRLALDYRDYYTTRETLGDKVVAAMSCQAECGEAFSNVYTCLYHYRTR